MSPSPSPLAPRPLAWLLSLAVAAPTLLAYNLSPSATLLNQLLALAGWAAVLLGLGLAAAQGQPLVGAARPHRPLLAALALLLAGVAGSWWQGLPSSLALSSAALLLLAGLLAIAASTQTTPAAAQLHSHDDPVHLFHSAVLLAGLASAAVALVQVFAPDWADGQWLARSGLPGRAVGNVRQPNQLSTLLLWALISLVPLLDAGRWFGQALRRELAWALGAVLVLAVVLTASRTGTVGIVLLAAWGVADKRLDRASRAALLAAPLVYLACWLGMAEWAQHTQHTFGGQARLGESDLSASRFGIWANTLSLIAANPWTGVGWGQFNFAWTLTAFPTRPVAYFDHSHNLPLQLAVELGLPLATLVMGLLLWAFVQAARRSWQVTGGAGAGARAAWMIVLMAGVHSQLEYPLWYAYFLFPTVWAWGLALRSSSAPAATPRTVSLLTLGGAVVALGTLLALQDYRSVTAIFIAGDGESSLQERVAQGQRSLFFSHHADYAAATTASAPEDAWPAFAGTTRSLIDARLMMAWARALDARGERDKARYLADRLREFKKPDADAFFAPCASEQPEAQRPFQCSPASGSYRWQDFRDLLARPR